MSKRRFYVTMTWDDWPEGGSFGTIVEAEDYSDAEDACRLEMAETRFDPEIHDSESEVLASYGDEWFVVDCFPLDEFIKEHTK